MTTATPRTVLAVFAALSLVACGSGSHTALPDVAAADAPYNGLLANATLTFTIAKPSTNAKVRQPSYVSSATASVKIVLNSSSTLSAAQVTSYNALPWGTMNVGTLPSATCPASGAVFVCTLSMMIPPGSDNLTFSLYDGVGGTGNVLSRQIQTFTLVAGQANAFSLILDANVTTPSGSMVVDSNTSSGGSCQISFAGYQRDPLAVITAGSTFNSTGTTAVTFSVAYTDAQGKTIVAPGLPKLEIQDNTSTYQASSGTIDGSSIAVTTFSTNRAAQTFRLPASGSNTLAFGINQAAQTFTLTPSNDNMTAPVNLRAVQADSSGTSDGLSFTQTLSFTFSTCQSQVIF